MQAVGRKKRTHPTDVYNGLISDSFQGSFPGNLQLVLVLRPTTLLQRTLSDILFKFNKDEFKMKVPVRTVTLTIEETNLLKNDHKNSVWCVCVMAVSVSGDHAELNN